MNRFKSLLPMAIFVGLAVAPNVFAEKLVILHTNDTHSQIDPAENDNLGGILRRKVVVDSVRAAEKKCFC